MKRNIASFFVLVILSLSMVSAISLDIKETYSPKENIISEISGSVLEPIIPTNVELRRGHILVPWDYEIKKLGEQYYLWAIAPEQEMNYTLIIKDITTHVSGEIKKINYEKNFSVSGNLTDYYIRPGFVLTEKDFEIKVQLNEDFDKTIDLIFLETTDYTLKPGENTIEFSISEINETKTFNITIGKYDLPAHIRIDETSPIRTRTNISNASEIIDLTNLTIVEDLSEEELSELEQERLKYNCYEVPGNVCEADETCSGNSIITLDGQCCVNGVCESSDEDGGLAWVGYLIAAIVIIVGVFVWLRYKRVKVIKNPIEKRALGLHKKKP